MNDELLICERCDGAMTITAEAKPVMLITGDVETGNRFMALCHHCGNRVVLKD